jgi:hypothetical protein
MSTYLIRFNKSRGQPGRGTLDHVWRVFEGEKEYLVKHVQINVPCRDTVTGNGSSNEDWSFKCQGIMVLDRSTSTAIIDPYEPTCTSS